MARRLKGERNNRSDWPTAIVTIARGIAPGKRMFHVGLLHGHAGFFDAVGREDLKMVHPGSMPMVARPYDLVLRGDFNHRYSCIGSMGSNHRISIGQSLRSTRILE